MCLGDIVMTGIGVLVLGGTALVLIIGAREHSRLTTEWSVAFPDLPHGRVARVEKIGLGRSVQLSGDPSRSFALTHDSGLVRAGDMVVLQSQDGGSSWRTKEVVPEWTTKRRCP